MYNISFFFVLPFVSYYHFESLLTICNISHLYNLFIPPPLPRVLYALRLLTTNRLIVQLLRERFFLRDRRIFAFSFVCLFFLFFFTRTSPEYTAPFYLPNYRSQLCYRIISFFFFFLFLFSF